MLCSLAIPEHLSPHSLDDYLQRGWFRMGQSMFTTSFLNFNGTLFNAVWLKYNLADFRLSVSQKKLFSLNKKFDIVIKPFELNSQKKALFAKYRQSLPFTIAEQLSTLLMGDASYNIFNTYEVSIFDGSKIIACGVFDLGNISAQGIINFFDPEYSKYSLGRYLILKKIEFLQKNNFITYYPGYFVPGYKPFDYKLNVNKDCIDAYSVLDKTWISIDEIYTENLPLKSIKNKLEDIQIILESGNFNFPVMRYQFYDLNIYTEYYHLGLFESPYMIFCFEYSHLIDCIINYNVETSKYEFLTMQKLYKSNLEPTSDIYNTFFLKKEKVLVSHANAEIFVSLVENTLKQNQIIII